LLSRSLRQAAQPVFDPRPFRHSEGAAVQDGNRFRKPRNGNVRGSTPPPSAIILDTPMNLCGGSAHGRAISNCRPSRGGGSAVRAAGLYPVGRWCNSILSHHLITTATTVIPTRVQFRQQGTALGKRGPFVQVKPPWPYSRSCPTAEASRSGREGSRFESEGRRHSGFV
jgi:hypothetical protein